MAELSNGTSAAAAPAPAPAGAPAAAPAAPAPAAEAAEEVWDAARWAAEDAEWTAFKGNVPYLYEHFAHHFLQDPCFGAAWGTVLHRGRGAVVQTAYFSRATQARLDPKDPAGRRWIGRGNFLYGAEIKLPARRRADPSRLGAFNEMARSGSVTVTKRLVHPGQVNNIKVVPQRPQVVITHTDEPTVYVWNFATQTKGRAYRDAIANVPNLMLEGHEASNDSFYYALDVSSARPLVVSGGSDRAVCVWALDEYLAPSSAWPERLAPDSFAEVPRVRPLHRFADAHSATVEDTRWMPGSESLFASVGDDRALRLWDLRVAGYRALELRDLHDGDINSVSWCDANTSLLATGSDDGTAKVLDFRALGEAHASADYSGVGEPAVRTLQLGAQVKLVAWRPGSDRHLATCASPAAAADGAAATHGMDLWDLGEGGDAESRVMFRHRGHRAPLTCCEWNPHAAWTLLTVADHNAHPSGQLTNAAMQVWTPTDLVTRDRVAVVADARAACASSSAGDAPPRKRQRTSGGAQ